MYGQTGMYSGPLEYNFVMGVASGMPADPELLPILLKLKAPDAHWQVTAIGRAKSGRCISAAPILADICAAVWKTPSISAMAPR